MKYKDIAGQRFGSLVVIEKVEKRNNKDRHAHWKCLCDCGNYAVITSARLRSGQKTCGCSNNGKSTTRLYRIWNGMKKRCYTPNEGAYKYYGARGISVCDEWKNNFFAFKEWAIKTGYNDGLTIDRIDVNGNYSPSNCRWATRKEQANNTRRNRILTFNGKSMNIAEWSKETGIKQNTILYRIKRNWSVERALTEGATR